MRLSRLSAICGIIGLGLFIAGFFLPAVRFPPDPQPEGRWGPGSTSHDFPGWVCAEVTLDATASFLRKPNAEVIPAVLSGWINPLLLLYLLSCAVKRLNRTRPSIAGAIAVCCVTMWIQLALDHVALLLGHYLWIAGIALVLSAPLASHLGTRKDPGENTGVASGKKEKANLISQTGLY
jgi:hypothetical protein